MYKIVAIIYNLYLITLNYVFNVEHHVFAIFFRFDHAFMYSLQLFVAFIYIKFD